MVQGALPVRLRVDVEPEDAVGRLRRLPLRLFDNCRVPAADMQLREGCPLGGLHVFRRRQFQSEELTLDRTIAGHLNYEVLRLNTAREVLAEEGL